MVALAMQTSRPLFAARAPVAVRRTTCRAPMRIFATSDVEDKPVEAASTTPIEVPSPATNQPVRASAAALPDYGAVFAFGGEAPELVNGRLAMLGFLAAVGAEIGTGQSLAQQWTGEGFIGFIGATAVFLVASLIPIFKGVKNTEAFGPFTPQREMFNGRAAMVGLMALLAVEALKGSALF